MYWIKNIQSDSLEGRFESYIQLSGADCFGSDNQFRGAGKSIRVKSIMNFSEYTMKEGSNIMGDELVKTQAELKY